MSEIIFDIVEFVARELWAREIRLENYAKIIGR